MNRRPRSPWIAPLVGLLLAAGCHEVGPGEQPPECDDGAQRCVEQTLQTCSEGRWTLLMECSEPTPVCSTDLGCFSCLEGTRFCDEEDVRVCNADGVPGDVLESCDATPNGFCVDGRCTSPCEQAEAAQSYLGCDYWPTPLANGWLSLSFAQNFGVVVHNPGAAAAQVVITRGDQTLEDRTVGPGALEVFSLPIETGLKLSGSDMKTYLVPDAAYHLTSTMPVAAYQFNPLDYDLSTPEYNIFSYTNDAALLLPTHVLTGNYLATSRATVGVNDDGLGWDFVMSPGFVTIVGTEPYTEVWITSSCYTENGMDQMMTPIQGMAPGEQATFVLHPGDALQLLSEVPDDLSTCDGSYVSDDCNGWDDYTVCEYCDLGPSYDLTGTRIQASAPVAVYTGHNCTFVPFDKWACDHLEEQLFPLETWGSEFVVGVTEPQSPAGPEPNVVRVLSGADDNTVTFSPRQVVGASVTLDTGEWVELEASASFHVQGTGPLLVSQFLVGQNYNTGALDLDGDPAFALLVPVAQFRSDYAFLAPRTFSSSYVNVVKPVGEQSPVVSLDGTVVPETAFSLPVGDSGYGVARLPIAGTQHRIEATAPVGILVYGFARYTSYLYPGGLDLHRINPVE